VAALSNDSVDPGSASSGRTSSATGTLRQYSSCVREKARRTVTGKGSEGRALQTTCRSLQLQWMARPRNGRRAARHNRTATQQQRLVAQTHANLFAYDFIRNVNVHNCLQTQ
jgi:hypothetical protein